MVKVELIIEKETGARSKKTEVIELEYDQTDLRTLYNAELKYLNEYINRDVFVRNFENMTEAKKYAKLKIKSKILL